MDPEATLNQLRSVHSAVVDSSSIIYAEKSGLLEVLSRALTLWTVSGVENEVGRPIPDVTVADVAAPDLPVDDLVILLAASHAVPIVSEDRKLLMKADERHIDTYNMLAILELLLFRGHLSLLQWDRARKRLLATANYGAHVVHAATQLHWAVRKAIG